MGLDCSHDAWSAAYSAFYRWRLAVAEAAGYKTGIGMNGTHYILDWENIPEGALMGEWEETPEDPLVVLLAHSDCDGHIHPEQAKPLADRLEELLPKLDSDWHPRTDQFITGLCEASAANETLLFH